MAVFGIVMLTAAVRGRAGSRLRALALGAGAVLAGLAGLAGGVAALVWPGMTVDGVPLPAEIYLVGLVLVGLLVVPGLLRPHQRRDPLTRLRVGLDTVGVTAGLMFPPWLLIFSEGEMRGASMIAIVLGALATAVAAVAGVHSVRHRAALIWCGPGVALLLICLTALAVAGDNPGNPNSAIASLAAAGAINLAAALVWWGSVRVSPDAGPLPPVGGEPAAGFPLFALPVLASAVALAWQLLHGRSLDAMSIVLITATVLAVAAREFTAAIALRRHADHLTDQGNRLRSLMFGSSDVAMVLDAGLTVRWQSPAAARHFGLSDQDVLGRPVSALVHPDQVDDLDGFLAARLGDDAAPAEASLVVRLRDGFGRLRETEWTAGGNDPAQPGLTLVLHIRDVSDRRELEQALRQAAHLDPLTGLVNRQGLRRAGDPVRDAGALIVLELGGLTAVADVHGSDRAEMVLVEAARRLRTRVAGADVPARIGDTRLAVLTHGGAIRAHLLASQLVTVLTAPYDDVPGAAAHLSVWAGMSDLDAGTDVDEVLRRAALALRAVASGPPGAVEWYDVEMEARLLRRSTLEQDLPYALDRHELHLRYQPVIELATSRPVGVEAVLSWRHPSLGDVPAAELLPLADDLGLLGELRTWVLRLAGRQLADWRTQYADLWLSVAVRPRELDVPSFQAALDATLENHGIPESALVVEITEDDLQHGPQESGVGGHLRRLRARGIRTAIGHFGAGHTSLSRLRILPVDLLKVDREVFGQPTAGSRAAGAIMDVTVTLGRRLGMDVVAHGLDSAADLETVRAAGCRLGQGDLLAQAMPAERLEALLEQHGDRSRHSG